MRLRIWGSCRDCKKPARFCEDHPRLSDSDGLGKPPVVKAPVVVLDKVSLVAGMGKPPINKQRELLKKRIVELTRELYGLGGGVDAKTMAAMPDDVKAQLKRPGKDVSGRGSVGA